VHRKPASESRRATDQSPSHPASSGQVCTPIAIRVQRASTARCRMESTRERVQCSALSLQRWTSIQPPATPPLPLSAWAGWPAAAAATRISPSIRVSADVISVASLWPRHAAVTHSLRSTVLSLWHARTSTLTRSPTLSSRIPPPPPSRRRHGRRSGALAAPAAAPAGRTGHRTAAADDAIAASHGRTCRTARPQARHGQLQDAARHVHGIAAAAAAGSLAAGQRGVAAPQGSHSSAVVQRHLASAAHRVQLARVILQHC